MQIARRAASSISLLAAGVVLGLAMSGAPAAPIANTTPAAHVVTAAGTPSTDYTGPFTTAQHVPSVCLTSVTQTRYYNAHPPAGTTDMRTGGHGHGGYLKCIYIYLDGPAVFPGDHPYGKWIIQPGLGIPIPQPNGLGVNYQDCFQYGTSNGLPYHFPGAPSIGPQNDCGESFLVHHGDTWYYTGTTNPMYPSTTP